MVTTNRTLLIILLTVFSSKIIQSTQIEASSDPFDCHQAEENAPGNELDQMKDRWASFFSQKPKVVFTDKVKNVVKGSENQIRGVRNQVEGNKNKLIGMENFLFGEENDIFSLSNSVFWKKNKIINGNQRFFRHPERK